MDAVAIGANRPLRHTAAVGPALAVPLLVERFELCRVLVALVALTAKRDDLSAAPENVGGDDVHLVGPVSLRVPVARGAGHARLLVGLGDRLPFEIQVAHQAGLVVFHPSGIIGPGFRVQGSLGRGDRRRWRQGICLGGPSGGRWILLAGQ